MLASQQNLDSVTQGFQLSSIGHGRGSASGVTGLGIMRLSKRLAAGISIVTIGSFSTLLALRSPIAPLTTDPILEIHAGSLTTYLKDAATNVQGVRPRVGQRGVNVDGGLRSGTTLPVAVAGNPFGTPWNVQDCAV